MSLIYQGTVLEDGGVVVMARVRAFSGEYITQADIDSITAKIADMDDPSATAAALDAPVVADSVFDTLQTDTRWTNDATGYNFRYQLSHEDLSAGGKRYRVEFRFVEVDGGEFPFAIDLTTQPIWGS